MASKSGYRLAVVVLAIPLLASCDLQYGNEGDCHARIGYDERIYEQDGAVNEAAPRGELLGSGDVLDCDGEPVLALKVFAIKGVSPSVAIRTVGEYPGVYVARESHPSDWPSILNAP